MGMQQVNSVMQTHIVAVSKDTTVGTAIQLMEKSAVSLLPVLYGGKLVGVVTKKELEKGMKMKGGAQTAVETVMPENFDFINGQASIDDAARIMIKRKLARLPVVNNSDDMLCIGIISATEIFSSKQKK